MALGKRFIFDHHDLCPELYMSRYSAKSGLFVRLLRLMEWCSLKTADVTIATNESYKTVQMHRGRKEPSKIFIMRNGPNNSRMSPPAPNPALRQMGKSILCYVGCLNPQDGVDHLLCATASPALHVRTTGFPLRHHGNSATRSRTCGGWPTNCTLMGPST